MLYLLHVYNVPSDIFWLLEWWRTGGRLVIKRPFCAAIIFLKRIIKKKNTKKHKKKCYPNEYRIWLFIRDGRKRCRWDHSSRLYIYYNTPKQKKKSKNQNKKKTPTYLLRLETVSSIFPRYATWFRGGGAYYSNEMARELHITIIQMYTTKLYIYI